MKTKYDFVLTLISLPPNRVYDEQYQAHTWKFILPAKDDDPWNMQNRERILHVPSVRLAAKTKREFLANITDIAGKMWDRTHAAYKTCP